MKTFRKLNDLPYLHQQCKRKASNPVLPFPLLHHPFNHLLCREKKLQQRAKNEVWEISWAIYYRIKLCTLCKLKSFFLSPLVEGLLCSIFRWIPFKLFLHFFLFDESFHKSLIKGGKMESWERFWIEHTRRDERGGEESLNVTIFINHFNAQLTEACRVNQSIQGCVRKASESGIIDLKIRR